MRYNFIYLLIIVFIFGGCTIQDSIVEIPSQEKVETFDISKVAVSEEQTVTTEPNSEVSLPEGLTVTVIADLLNVRSSPSIEGEVVFQVSEGEIFLVQDVFEEVAGEVWLRIELEDLTDAWIAAWYCQVIDEEILRAINGLYIGEGFPSGDIYLQPLVNNGRKGNTELPMAGKFASLVNGDMYDISYDSDFEVYVPDIESDSRFYYQPFSTPIHSGLKYKGDNIVDTFLGVSYFYDEITVEAIALESKRVSTPREKENALERVKNDNEISEEDRTLDYITLEETIVGAINLCHIQPIDYDYSFKLSYYQTHSFEYVYEVYVLDVLYKGSVVGTWERIIGDGPY